MSDAITIFYYVFNKIYNFLFSQALISQGVSIGWIFITVIIFGIIIRSVLNVPNGISERINRNNHDGKGTY